jgi:hypothetical protein
VKRAGIRSVVTITTGSGQVKPHRHPDGVEAFLDTLTDPILFFFAV